MPDGEIPRATPASWASTQAQVAFFQEGEFGMMPEDEEILARMEQDADDLNFLDQTYFVETSRGLSIPASFGANEPVTYGSFYGLTFEGTFRGYSKVMIGRIIGAQSVRAFCLTFEDALLLPYFDNLPADHLLHVPVLAVDSMSQT